MFAAATRSSPASPAWRKRLLVRTVAQVLDLNFKRIQFTPDLMPADITGTEIIEEDRATGQRAAAIHSRTDFRQHHSCRRNQPHAAQDAGRAARSDAGRQVTVAGHDLSAAADPFFVLATQNPIEMEGTYPLPEAQLDRFMFNIVIDYLPEDDEIQVVNLTTSPQEHRVRETDAARDYRVPDVWCGKCRRPNGHALCRAAGRAPAGPDRDAPRTSSSICELRRQLRASQFLILGGKARALLNGRYNVSCEDIRRGCTGVSSPHSAQLPCGIRRRSIPTR